MYANGCIIDGNSASTELAPGPGNLFELNDVPADCHRPDCHQPTGTSADEDLTASSGHCTGVSSPQCYNILRQFQKQYLLLHTRLPC